MMYNTYVQANQRFDHLAIVLDKDVFLHVGPPTIRLLPTAILLSERRSPMVLRPSMTDAEMEEFLKSLRELVGLPYDTLTTYKLIAQIWLGKMLGFTSSGKRIWAPLQGSHRCYDFDSNITRTSPNSSLLPSQPQSFVAHSSPSQPSTPTSLMSGQDHGTGACDCNAQAISESSSPCECGESFGRNICTDAILKRLMHFSPKFREAALKLKGALTAQELDSWTLTDVEVLKAANPHLLREVVLDSFSPTSDEGGVAATNNATVEFDGTEVAHGIDGMERMMLTGITGIDSRKIRRLKQKVVETVGLAQELTTDLISRLVKSKSETGAVTSEMGSDNRSSFSDDVPTESLLSVALILFVLAVMVRPASLKAVALTKSILRAGLKSRL